MLRSLLIYLSQAPWARKIVTGWSFAWNAASRFVAGEEIDDAIKVIKYLNDKGINATLDHLGEHTHTAADARNATATILTIFEAINQSEIRSNVSIKLTQIGLALDTELCAENLTKILERAKEYNNFVRIDMEDSPWIHSTLTLYRKMHLEKGFDNIGVVIQSYLFRSEADIQQLIGECTGVRLCKGAYKEPPEIAYPKKGDVDANYDHLARLLIDGSNASGCPQVSSDGRIPPTVALATHDEKRIDYAKSYAEKVHLPQAALEFQMLFGIRSDLQEQLTEAGYPVRVYVPYGHEWYPFFTRRLAERPANLWFFISNFFRR